MQANLSNILLVVEESINNQQSTVLTHEGAVVIPMYTVLRLAGKLAMEHTFWTLNIVCASTYFAFFKSSGNVFIQFWLPTRRSCQQLHYVNSQVPEV